MTRLELIARLERMDACGDSLDWLRGLTCETAEEAYAACEQVNWMLWLAGRAGLRHQAVSLACDYAERVLPIAETWLRANRPKRADAPRRAIEAARAGTVTPAIRRAAYAAAAAYAADTADYATDAAYAAYAADYATDAAYAADTADTADTADYAAYAADAAAAAAAAAAAYAYADADAADAYAAARSTERVWQAARFREVISWTALLAAMEDHHVSR
jgi:hypothetical protein